MKKKKRGGGGGGGGTSLEEENGLVPFGRHDQLLTKHKMVQMRYSQKLGTTKFF